MGESLLKRNNIKIKKNNNLIKSYRGLVPLERYDRSPNTKRQKYSTTGYMNDDGESVSNMNMSRPNFNATRMNQELEAYDKNLGISGLGAIRAKHNL